MVTVRLVGASGYIRYVLLPVVSYGLICGLLEPGGRFLERTTGIRKEQAAGHVFMVTEVTWSREPNGPVNIDNCRAVQP